MNEINDNNGVNNNDNDVDNADNNNDAEHGDVVVVGVVQSDDDKLARLRPPPSCGERFRDGLLRTLDGPVFQTLGLVVLFFVVMDGAFFFFLLVGWQAMCRPRTDCPLRNQWYNISVQILNGLFTYMALVSMPWRSTNFLHLFGWGCPRRDRTDGRNLYGQPTNDIWFHLTLWKRQAIVVVLLLNCLTQFANQATRIVYYTYNLQDTSPGNIWTNVFFASSMICAAVAGIWQGLEEDRLRKAHPNRFPPGPLDLIKAKLCKRTQEDDDDKEDDQGEEEEEIDPTREHKRRFVTPLSRPSLRLWGM